MSQEELGSAKSYALSAAAEKLRLDIKEIVNKAIPASQDDTPESSSDNVTFFNEDEDGTRAYGGKLLDKKVSELVTGMNLDGVSTCGILQHTHNTYDIIAMVMESGFQLPFSTYIKQIFPHVARAALSERNYQPRRTLERRMSYFYTGWSYFKPIDNYYLYCAGLIGHGMFAA